MLLCHTGLALSSSVAGFGVSLSSVSFLLRSSFVVFIFSWFVVSGLLAGSLCVLLRIRACICAVSFVKISNFVKFRQISRKFQIFIFLIFRRILPRMTPADSTAISAFSSPPCFSSILRRFLRSNLSNFLCPVLVCATSKRGYSRLCRSPPSLSLSRGGMVFFGVLQYSKKNHPPPT